MRKVYRDNRGLTLVELLLGVAILGIIVAPLLNAFVTGAGAEVRGRKYGDATAAAQNIMETIQAVQAGDDLAGAVKATLGGDYYVLAADGFQPRQGHSSEDGKRYIGVEGYEDYDLMVTVDSSAAINREKVPVSNALDLMVDMTKADETAREAFNLELAFYNEAEQKSFSRTGVTISAGNNAGRNSYDIEVAFNYSGSFTYKDNEEKEVTGSFTHSVTASAGAAVPEIYVSGRPVFSLFLFLNAESISPRISALNNITWGGQKADFNLFLIFSRDKQNLSPYVEYRPQNDKSEVRVFSNAKPFTYYACDENGWGEARLTTGELVETDVYDRFYNVTVSLYEKGRGFAAESLLTELEGVKLD